MKSFNMISKERVPVQERISEDFGTKCQDDDHVKGFPRLPHIHAILILQLGFWSIVPKCRFKTKSLIDIMHNIRIHECVLVSSATCCV